MTEFKVGDKCKKKESMWRGLGEYPALKRAVSLTVSKFKSGQYPSVSFQETGYYEWDAAYFELVEEEKVKNRFAVGDKVISIKNTPDAEEGFIGFIVRACEVDYDWEVKPLDGGLDKAFNEDELELLSLGKRETKFNPTLSEIENYNFPDTITPQDIAGVSKAEYTGGSSSYYKVDVTNPTTSDSPYQAECNDVIEALGLTFTEGNIFKAIWRIAADRQGKKKKGNNSVYDAEKVVFFAERLLIQEKSKEGK